MFGRMKDPVEGTARLVSYQETNAVNEFHTTIIAQVIVEADGVVPTAVEAIHGVPHSQLPLAGGTVWRVQIDRSNPSRLKFLAGDRKAGKAQRIEAQEQARRVAEQMRGATESPDASADAASPTGPPVAPPPGFGVPGMPQIQVIGNADPARVQEALGKVREMFGVNLGDAAAVGGPASGGQPPAGDDTVGQLERLARLRDAGALTEAEFQAEKAKVLGGGG